MGDEITIVILAAGLGTRMVSRKAKVLHEAGGMPLVEHVVQSALAAAKPDRVIVVVGHQKELVEERLAGYRIRFARQTEQKGTGHALMVCRDVVPDHAGRLVVLYGDCPLLRTETLERLLKEHAAGNAAATVITTILDDPTGYGRVLTDSAGYVTAIVEHKVADREQRAVRQINSGIYCFDATLLWAHLFEIQPNPVAGEFYLTDIVEILNRVGHRVRTLLHEDATELLGINTRLELARVDEIFRTRKIRQLMAEGVTVRNPSTVTVDQAVRIGPDSVIEPFAQVLGNTEIGEECVIGAGAIVRNAILGDGVEIGPYTLVSDSTIDNGAKIGPFARLRQENQIGPGARIGNFVELKKTRFGAGAKAGHLAYLGDSVIGARSNIGAGTITCNYDGEKKHETTIGQGVFVGSNSTIVAPVELRDGCYTAAGSVITSSVPAEALAIGRARQTIKEGWVRRKKRIAASSSGPSSVHEQ